MRMQAIGLDDQRTVRSKNEDAQYVLTICTCCYADTSTCSGDGNNTSTCMNVLSYLHIITLAAASNRHANVALKETIRSFPNRRSGSRRVTPVARSRKNQFWIQFLNIQSKDIFTVSSLKNGARRQIFFVGTLPLKPLGSFVLKI